MALNLVYIKYGSDTVWKRFFSQNTMKSQSGDAYSTQTASWELIDGYGTKMECVDKKVPVLEKFKRTKKFDLFFGLISILHV